MSAGICGKRLGFEDIFGSPSSSSLPLPKRSRRSPPYASVSAVDNLSFLIGMFPSMDREVIESILNSHNENIDEAIKSLHSLCLGDDTAARDESVSLDSFLLPNHGSVEDGMIYQASEKKAEETQVTGQLFEVRAQDATRGILVGKSLSTRNDECFKLGRCPRPYYKILGSF